MNSKPWYASKTIWASIIGALSAALALIGQNIDAGTQTVLVNDITAAADLIATVSGIIAGISRAKATTTIGEQK